MLYHDVYEVSFACCFVLIDVEVEYFVEKVQHQKHSCGRAFIDRPCTRSNSMWESPNFVQKRRRPEGKVREVRWSKCHHLEPANIGLSARCYILGRCGTHISPSNTSERNEEPRFCVRFTYYDPSAEVSQLRDTVSSLQQRLEEARGSDQAVESEVYTDSSGIRNSRCIR